MPPSGAHVGDERLHERGEAAAQPEEDRAVGGSRPHRRRGTQQGALPGDGGREPRERRPQREVLRPARVDAAEQRVDQPVDDLAPEAARDERPDGDVALRRRAGKDEVQTGARHARAGEHA